MTKRDALKQVEHSTGVFHDSFDGIEVDYKLLELFDLLLSVRSSNVCLAIGLQAYCFLYNIAFSAVELDYLHYMDQVMTKWISKKQIEINRTQGQP